MGIPRKMLETLMGRQMSNEEYKTGKVNLRTKRAKAAAKPAPKSKYRSQAEADYALKLEVRKRAGQIVDYRYEAVKFRVGMKGKRASVYTPDFLVTREYEHDFTMWGEDRYIIEFHEVKGVHRGRERGLAVFYAAKELFPMFIWILIEA